MRQIMVASVMLVLAGCGDSDRPVTVTPDMETKLRENEKRVQEAESEWQKRPTTGDQEAEARQRRRDQRVHEAESAWQQQQPQPRK